MAGMSFCYGPFASQEGDLHLPSAKMPPVVCLLHGGFWRMPYGRDQLSAVADDLASQGYAVWNIGYRRVGERGGGWPGTLEDVANSIDHLAELSDTVAPLDLKRVVVAGHSAGGQLALCAGADRRGTSAKHLAPSKVRPIAVAGLAAVADLEKAFELDSGNGAVNGLLDGEIDQKSDRYAFASPIRNLPLRIPQFILHGTHDDAVPVDLARHYVRAARRAGDRVRYAELAGAGHMDYLDVASEAHRALSQWLGGVSKPGR